MRELPIIMCTEMVKAILEGRKTQTRRIITGITPHYQLGKKPTSYGPTDWAFFDMADPVGTYPTLIQSRYRVGDELWVKETWGVFDEAADEDVAIGYKAGPDDELIWSKNKAYLLKGDYRIEKWRSSRFMFKDFARLWLRVTAVIDPHPIQNISEDDAIAEGIECHCDVGSSEYDCCSLSAEDHFAMLWEHLHPMPSERWEDNPWVFGYEIERIKK